MLIGVFKDKDPIKTMRKERVMALVKEAKKQQVALVFFSSENIDFTKKIIHGKINHNGKWLHQTVPFPKAMINESPRIMKNRSEIENRIRKEIPYTTYLIDGKTGIYKKLEGSEDYHTLIIPSHKLENTDQLAVWFAEFNKIVIKPTGGRQGKGIYFIEKISEQQYKIKNHRDEQIIIKEELIQLVKELINKQLHLIQPYLVCRTKQDEPYDFRVHVQRNGEGQWVVTKAYPRMGAKESNLSNISQGGRTEPLEDFLAKEWPEYKEELKEILEETAIGLAKYIDSKYRFTIDELGIDLAIDENNKMWLYEINTGPQTKYHEAERAVNTIAYAKYIAKHNDKVTTEVTQKETTIIDTTKNKKPILIGMLTSTINTNRMKIASAAVASLYGYEFFYFTPKRMNFETKEAEGRQFIDGEWRKVVYNYKTDINVIYDRLRAIGRNNYQKYYDELAGIPMTHESYGVSFNKRIVYERFQNIKGIEQWLIPYAPYSIENALEFLTRYQKIIIKPQAGSFGQGLFYIEKQKKDFYITQKESRWKIKHNDMIAWLTEFIKSNNYVIQKFISSRTKENQAFDIRVHLGKNQHNKWDFIVIYPRIGIEFEKITSTLEGGYIGNWKGFITRQFDEQTFIHLDKEIKEASLAMVKAFMQTIDKKITEAGLDFVIDASGQLHFIEINVRQPGIFMYEFDVAQRMIGYAASIAKK